MNKVIELGQARQFKIATIIRHSSKPSSAHLSYYVCRLACTLLNVSFSCAWTYAIAQDRTRTTPTKPWPTHEAPYQEQCMRSGSFHARRENTLMWWVTRRRSASRDWREAWGHRWWAWPMVMITDKHLDKLFSFSVGHRDSYCRTAAAKTEMHVFQLVKAISKRVWRLCYQVFVDGQVNAMGKIPHWEKS